MENGLSNEENMAEFQSEIVWQRMASFVDKEFIPRQQESRGM